jgi:hypothetical protein
MPSTLDPRIKEEKMNAKDTALAILSEVQSPHSDAYVHHDVKRKIYSGYADSSREMADFHHQEAERMPKFSTERKHHADLAKHHHEASSSYANLSALHQGLRDESERK